MQFSLNRMVILTLILNVIITAFSYGQSTEISVQAGSGLFSFGGESATKTSFLNVSDISSIPSYTNNPYGKYSGFSYGFGAQVQRISRSTLIYGLQVSYESLSSKVKIDGAYGKTNWAPTIEDGETILTNNFVNLNPFIGKRFELKSNVKIDFKFGFDFAACLSSKEKYDITTTQGDNITGSVERNKPNLDFRSRIEMVNYYKKVGFSIGYSYGLTNYTSGLVGADRVNQSRYFRLGLSYIIK
ncbi:MAG: hypothetical protein ABI663_19330 [Chryseolinea sp.]